MWFPPKGLGVWPPAKASQAMWFLPKGLVVRPSGEASQSATVMSPVEFLFCRSGYSKLELALEVDGFLLENKPIIPC